eukprot:6197369-Pleurochrysis_carterae.AAC.3
MRIPIWMSTSRFKIRRHARNLKSENRLRRSAQSFLRAHIAYVQLEKEHGPKTLKLGRTCRSKSVGRGDDHFVRKSVYANPLRTNVRTVEACRAPLTFVWGAWKRLFKLLIEGPTLSRPYCLPSRRNYPHKSPLPAYCVPVAKIDWTLHRTPTRGKHYTRLRNA